LSVASSQWQDELRLLEEVESEIRDRFVERDCLIHNRAGVAGLAQSHAGAPENLPEPPKIFSPYVERTATDSNLAEGVYWGDTHLHTSYSTDAGMFGNTLGPEEAYRFARGEEVLTAHGMRARLIRPLDFLVVSDHAENLGLAPMIKESNPELLKSDWGREIHDMVKAGKGYEAFIKWGSRRRYGGYGPDRQPEDVARGVGSPD